MPACGQVPWPAMLCKLGSHRSQKVQEREPPSLLDRPSNLWPSGAAADSFRFLPQPLVEITASQIADAFAFSR